MSNALIQVELKRGRQTRNMVWYAASSVDSVRKWSTVPHVYVKQTALIAAFGEFPERIIITIERS